MISLINIKTTKGRVTLPKRMNFRKRSKERGVKGRLELFRKFILFSSITRPYHAIGGADWDKGRIVE